MTDYEKRKKHYSDQILRRISDDPQAFAKFGRYARRLKSGDQRSSLGSTHRDFAAAQWQA
jgi:hypothetical protein